MANTCRCPAESFFHLYLGKGGVRFSVEVGNLSVRIRAFHMSRPLYTEGPSTAWIKNNGLPFQGRNQFRISARTPPNLFRPARHTPLTINLCPEKALRLGSWSPCHLPPFVEPDPLKAARGSGSYVYFTPSFCLCHRVAATSKDCSQTSSYCCILSRPPPFTISPRPSSL